MLFQLMTFNNFLSKCLFEPGLSVYEIDSLFSLRFLVILLQVNKVSFFEGGRDVQVCTNVVVNILSNQSHHTNIEVRYDPSKLGSFSPTLENNLTSNFLS